MSQSPPVDLCSNYSATSSFVWIVGTIPRPIHADETGLCRFSITNEAGRFYVQTRWLPQMEALQVGDEVQVVGTLHSFVFPRCRCHHVYIEPAVIVRWGGGEGSSVGHGAEYLFDWLERLKDHLLS